MSRQMGLNIELKKGDPEKLNGKLIAYATIDADMESISGSMGSMIKNGILAVQANYVDQRNIRDFFQAEFNISLEKGIEEIIEQARESGGLEGALDPEVVRDKLESMRNMEFIPIPAKIAFFGSEQEILQRDEDVYYLGHFKIVSHAHLCVNSFPILYQAKFREQEHTTVAIEIEEMLQGLDIPKKDTKPASQGKGNHKGFQGNIKDYLLKDLIPKMLYNLGKKEEYDKAEKQFMSFMSESGFADETGPITELIKSNLKDDAAKLSQLELLVERIEALQNENYKKLEIIKKKLEKLK
ncbi:hypothetical protein ACFL5V_13325 [Fibrobacterota bacterium]